MFALSSQMFVTRVGGVHFKYSVHLEGVLRSGLDPLGNGGNCTDPCEHVLQIGGCIQNLVVSSHSMDKIHKLLEVEL